MRVEARVTGQRRRPTEDRHVDVPARSIRLRDLIAAVVEAEVEAFRQRQADSRLFRVLSGEDIAHGVERGRVVSGGAELNQAVDRDAAVQNALVAFADGFYFVFVDDAQIETLDETVALSDDSTLLFLRLVPLAGG